MAATGGMWPKQPGAALLLLTALVMASPTMAQVADAPVLFDRFPVRADQLSPAQQGALDDVRQNSFGGTIETVAVFPDALLGRRMVVEVGGKGRVVTATAAGSLPDGRLGWRGGADDGTKVSLVFDGRDTAGVIVTADAAYRVSPVGGGLHVLMQVDPETTPEMPWEAVAEAAEPEPVARHGFLEPVFASGWFGHQGGRWRPDRHPRLIADLNGDGRADILGFGSDQVLSALGQPDGRFAEPQAAAPGFGYDEGWLADQHPRLLGDVDGDGKLDIVGFGAHRVWVARGAGDGIFAEPFPTLAAFTSDDGWRVDLNPRHLADVNGDGRADIVGFGDKRVLVALARPDGGFSHPVRGANGYSVTPRGIQGERLPRFVLDLNGDGMDDLLGFSSRYVWTSRARGDGTFRVAQAAVDGFGYEFHGYRSQFHIRIPADVNGDGQPDLVGFGESWVQVAPGSGDARFTRPQRVERFYTVFTGWSLSHNPRLMGDVNGDQRDDVVGFGDDAVYVSLGRADGALTEPRPVLGNFTWSDGWQDADRHPRHLADVDGDGRMDILGFGEEGVWVSLSRM